MGYSNEEPSQNLIELMNISSGWLENIFVLNHYDDYKDFKCLTNILSFD